MQSVIGKEELKDSRATVTTRFCRTTVKNQATPLWTGSGATGEGQILYFGVFF